MKKSFFLLLLFLFSCSTEPKIIDLNTQSILKDGIYLDKKSMKPLEGRVMKTTPDNVVIIDGYIKNGIPNGEWNEWYVNGFKHFSGTYNNGKKDGIFITYDIDGSFISEYEYSNGILNGIYRNNSVQGTYVNGKKNGLWKNFFFDKLISQIQYNNDVFDGIYETDKEKGTYNQGIKVGFWEEKMLSSEGSVRSGNYKNGKRDGEWVVKRNGIEISRIGYKENIFDGIYKDQKVEGRYVLGVKDGNWKIYNDDLKLISDINYNNGIFDGKYKTEDELGQYSNGIKTGYWIENSNYFVGSCRKMKTEGKYLNGKKDGTWKTVQYNILDLEQVTLTENYINGIYNGDFEQKGTCESYLDNFSKIVGQYENDLKSGIWKTYNSDNNIEKVENFVKGELSGESIEVLYTSYSSNSIDLLITKDYKNGLLNGNEIFYRYCYTNKNKEYSFHPTHVKSYKNNKLHGWSQDVEIKGVLCIMKVENYLRYSESIVDEMYNSQTLYFEGEKVYQNLKDKSTLTSRDYQIFLNNSKNMKNVYRNTTTYIPNTMTDEDWNWNFQDFFNESINSVDIPIEELKFDKKISDL